MNRQILPAILCAIAALCSLSAARAAADVTGLVPTIWWDFETRPTTADALKNANMGLISMSFTAVGDWTYQPGVTNGWALDTSACTAYAAACFWKGVLQS